MLTGRGLSERKLNGPGCTVDWVQLRTSTSPQLTVAIFQSCTTRGLRCNILLFLVCFIFLCFFLFCKLFPSKLSLFAILNLLQLNGYDATFCCWPFVFLFFVCFDSNVFFLEILMFVSLYETQRIMKQLFFLASSHL